MTEYDFFKQRMLEMTNHHLDPIGSVQKAIIRAEKDYKIYLEKLKQEESIFSIEKNDYL